MRKVCSREQLEYTVSLLHIAGQFVVVGVEEEETAVTLPTDDYGKLIHPIIGSDGELLPTDGSHRYVDPLTGEQVPVDDYGRPVNSEGSILPTDGTGRHIYTPPVTTPARPRPTEVIGPDGVPLPTDRDGRVIDGGQIVAYPDDRGDGGSTAEKQNRTCQLEQTAADILFAINDELLQYNGEYVKGAIKQLLNKHLDLAPDATRVAILHYGRSVEIPVNLGGYHEKGEILEKLQQIEHNNALGVPDLAAAYNAAGQQFAVFGRQNVVRLLIVFTAGDDM